jgi:anti-sigma B factor antagonist
MKVDVRHVGEAIIVDLNGRLVLGVGDEVLREVFNTILADGWKQIILNLENVSVMDSSGIGEVVSGWKLARRFEAKVKLLRPGDTIKHTLHLTQILPLLEVFEDEATALQSFA